MTTFRLISLPAHAVVEMAFGLALIAAPFALPLSAAATVSAFVLGALIVGLALGPAVEDRNYSVSAHFAADRGMSIGLIGAAIIIGLAGDALAASLFGAGGLLILGLSLVTRYTKPV